MTLIAKYQDDDFGGRRKVIKAVFYGRGQMELDLLRRRGSTHALTEQEAIRLAVRFAASELSRQDPGLDDEMGPREADPMGWQVGYKHLGKHRLQEWIKARIPLATGAELDMLRVLEPIGYIQRMNVLRDHYKDVLYK